MQKLCRAGLLRLFSPTNSTNTPANGGREGARKAGEGGEGGEGGEREREWRESEIVDRGSMIATINTSSTGTLARVTLLRISCR